MGIIRKILEYFSKKKQLKLDKSHEEKIKEFNDEILNQVDIILSSESDEKARSEKIYEVLRNHLHQALELGIIEKSSIYELATQFKLNPEIQNAIIFVDREGLSEKITFALTEKNNASILESLINQYVEKFCVNGNKLKYLTERQKYEIVESILKKRPTSEEKIDLLLSRLDSFYRNKYVYKILSEKNPKEALRLYNEYMAEFINGDSEEKIQFEEAINEDERLRKLACIRELGEDSLFTSMDKVPVFYDMTKETYDEKANQEVAESKEYKNIEAEDLVFIRTTSVFPMNGVVEPIGEHSAPENIGNLLIEPLKRIQSDLNSDKLQLLSPRFRWTSHWCINGIVGNHLQGNFSGRDFLIMEQAQQHADDEGLLNMLVSDVIYLGDMKLSPTAQVMMHIEKYKELMQDPIMREQLTKLEVVLYKGNAKDAFKMHMNQNGYVWGEISAFNYANIQKRDDPVHNHLRLIQESLRKGTIPEFEGCSYGSDEGLNSADAKSSRVRKKIQETNQKTNIILGQGKKQTSEETSICQMGASIDSKLTYDTFMQYKKYLETSFPQLKMISDEKYSEALFCQLGESSFPELIEPILRQIGVDNIIRETEAFNKMMLEKQKKARAAKDKKLLEEGLITSEEYNSRNYERRQNKQEQIEI